MVCSDAAVVKPDATDGGIRALGCVLDCGCVRSDIMYFRCSAARRALRSDVVTWLSVWLGPAIVSVTPIAIILIKCRQVQLQMRVVDNSDLHIVEPEVRGRVRNVICFKDSTSKLGQKMNELSHDADLEMMKETVGGMMETPFLYAFLYSKRTFDNAQLSSS